METVSDRVAARCSFSLRSVHWTLYKMIGGGRLVAELVGYSLLLMVPNFRMHNLGASGLTVSLSYPDSYSEVHKPLKTHLLEVLLRSPTKRSISLTVRFLSESTKVYRVSN